MKSLRTTAVLGLGLLVSACAGGTATPTLLPSPSPEPVADLQPVPLPGVEGFAAYCDLQDGSLQITVENTGGADAPASRVTVAFDYSSKIGSADAPSISAGGSAPVLVALPQPVTPDAFDFTITVDADRAIAESDEGNNYGEGQCPAEPR